jgi:hypothetical protein
MFKTTIYREFANLSKKLSNPDVLPPRPRQGLTQPLQLSRIELHNKAVETPWGQFERCASDFQN